MSKCITPNKQVSFITGNRSISNSSKDCDKFGVVPGETILVPIDESYREAIVQGVGANCDWVFVVVQLAGESRCSYLPYKSKTILWEKCKRT